MRWLALPFVLGACHPAAAPANPTRIDEVGWLEGDWGGQDKEVWTEEHWSSALGATMLGGNRSIREDRTIFFEFLRIEASPTEVVYWAAPRGGDPTPFRLVKSEGQKASFYNPNHDYPQWIVYERSGGTLKVHIEGVENGAPASHDWIWHRL